MIFAPLEGTMTRKTALVLGVTGFTLLLLWPNGVGLLLGAILCIEVVLGMLGVSRAEEVIYID